MGIIKVYVQAKEKESLEIAKETEKLYLTERLSYRASLRKAKENFNKEVHSNKRKLVCFINCNF